MKTYPPLAQDDLGRIKEAFWKRYGVNRNKRRYTFSFDLGIWMITQDVSNHMWVVYLERHHIEFKYVGKG